MSHPSYEEARRSALQSLDAGDAREALGRFRGAVEYPAQLGEDTARWRDALTVLSRSRLARADAIRGVTALDTRDLRGWHFVLTAGLLLHLSPYDLEEGMRGRYCLVQDQVEVCREGVQRAAAVLDALSLRPERVWVLPDPDSAALGLATGRILGVPAAPWPEAGAEEPGLIVAYDLAGLEDPVAETPAEHRPGQVLWAHASPWTDEPPFAADLTTYLHQCNVSPWGERLAVDPGGRDLTTHPPDLRPPEARAGDIAVARLAGDPLGDLAVLVELARAGGTTAAATRTQGPRLRQPVGSPVPSSRFA